MNNLYLSVEQSRREQQGLEAREVEASLNTDLYSGEFFITDFEKPLFFYHYRCTLVRQREMVGQGDGSCNSKEKKYEKQQYKIFDLTNTICCLGARSTESKAFKTRLASLEPLALSPDGDAGSQGKIAQKRELVAAVLSSCGASAAASSKQALKEEVNQKGNNPHSAKLTVSPGQKKAQLELNKSNPSEETNVAQVDFIVNKNWKELIPLLDSTGIPVNKTVTNLLKLYPPQKVEGAVALLKARKRDSHIPNPSGYFVSALKGDWAGQNLVNNQSDSDSPEVDQVAVFRHWYNLAKELGYCSGQQIREGEQWICLSGSWEQWSAAVKRGYSLDYLKKIMKRNQGQ